MDSVSVSPVFTNIITSQSLTISKEKWLENLQFTRVSRSDMNRLIMNYLVYEGYKEAAHKFSVEAGVELSGDLVTLDERIIIRDAILSGKILEAINTINSIHPHLLDSDKHLLFRLLQQQTIELIREGKIEAALDFAQLHLAERGLKEPNVLPDIECTLALLAFNEPLLSPYSQLLHNSHRQKVASEVNEALLKMVDGEGDSKLSHLLRLLHWTQDELKSSLKVKIPYMTDVATATLEYN